MCEGHVLIVDDLPDWRATLSGLLLDEGYDVHSVSSRAEALKAVADRHFDVAVLDVRLDEADEDNRDGLKLMYEIKEKVSDIAVIILTGYAEVEMVQEALQPNQKGIRPAFSFLNKTEIDQLAQYVKLAFEHAVSVVRNLIAQGESDRVEFKASMRWDYRTDAPNKGLQESVTRSIAGMLNSDGGTLLIGVADDGTILGVEKDLKALRKPNIDHFEHALTDVVKANLGIDLMQYIRTRFELIDGKHICVVSIQKSPEPVFFTKKNNRTFLIRAGNATHSLDVKDTVSYIQTHWGKAS